MNRTGTGTEMGTERMRRSQRFADAERAVAPAISKTLEIGLGVLLVALLTTTLYGSVVPGYRTAAGGELADQSLARAIAATERTVPPEAHAATTTVDVQLPATIRGATYEIHAVGDALELVHPHPEIGNHVRLTIPARVVTVTGTWRSTETFRVSAHTAGPDVTITIGGSDA